jgi:ATP-dependent helicase/nuclease subunit B
MLNFIVGVKNSGKTTKAHEVLGECAQQGKKTMLIVPKQFTFDTDKSLLHLLGPKTASEIEVLSFSRLCHVALKTYGGINKPVAKGGMREIFMSVAVEGIRDKLKVFSKHKNEIALVTKLLGEIDEMKNSGITPEEAEAKAQSLSDNMLKEKLLETAMVYRAYDAVVSQSHFDDEDMLMKVYEILRGTDFFKGTTVVIDGFKSFTCPEYNLIELMITKAENVYITLCSENLKDTNDLGAFGTVNAAARKLMLIAGNNGVETGNIIECHRKSEAFTTEMFHLQNNIYKPATEVFEAETDKVTVIKADSRESECDAVARQIKVLIRLGEYRCRDIAVVYRNDEKYHKAIAQAIRKYELPLFEDKRQPIANQPLICFVRYLLSICSEGYNSDYIFRLVKTGLCGYGEKEISELENYIFTWDISGKKWLSEFTANPDGFGFAMGEKQQKALENINALRKSITEPVEKLRESLKDVSGKKCAEIIYRYLRESKADERLKDYALLLENQGLGELAIEQEQVWDILMEILDELALSLGDRNVSVKRFLELFEIVVASKSLGKLPDGYDEVSICSADRMLTNSAKAVFVVGMNTGVFPLQRSQGGIFSAPEIKKLSDVGLEIGEDIKKLTSDERFICYNALSSATERIYISYCTTGDGGETLTESECVRHIISLFPNCKTINTANQDIGELVESRQSAFELMAKRYKLNDAKSQALKEYFRDMPEYQGKLEAIERAVSDKDFLIKNKNTAMTLFGKDMSFSASQLETYSKCPFMYFCRYGLRANPRERAKLDARMGGNVVHYVLEMVLSEYRNKEFLSLSEDKLHERIKFHLSEYMRLYMSDSEQNSIRFRYLYSRMFKILTHLFERLADEFGDSDFEPCEFELSIDRESVVKPFKVELKEGSVELTGKIDRVDKMDKDGKRYIRIVDYKTGVKDFELSDVFYGVNMQMLLYLISIWRGGSEFYENITPAGILYFPANLLSCDIDRNEDEESKQKKLLSRGKMKGMLVLDDDSIEAMDKSKRAVFLPITFDKKTGQVKGKFITLSQLEKLGKTIDDIIINMGDSLHDGIVGARPLSGSGNSETCQWCNYKDVCLKDNPKIRYAEKLSHDDCLRKLAGGEDSGENLD